MRLILSQWRRLRVLRIKKIVRPMARQKDFEVDFSKIFKREAVKRKKLVKKRIKDEGIRMGKLKIINR